MARTCGFMDYHFHAVAAEPGYAGQRRIIEAARLALRSARLAEVVTIPVVVHIVAAPGQPAVTDAQVNRQIQTLNEDFRGANADLANVPGPFQPLADDAGIEFRLATRDPLGRPTTGINRVVTQTRRFPRNPAPDLTAAIDAEVKVAGTGAPAWPRNEYLNLWVCDMGLSPLGYAAFPGSAAWRDGVVIDVACFGTGGTAQAPFDLGRTATHEVGHWLDLLHIWGDDRGACHASDNVADTPNQANSNGGRPAFPSVSCGNAPHGDMFMNYMDYVDDVAMFMFTKNQVDRMHSAIQGPRRSLLVSRGLDAPDAGARFGVEFEAATIPAEILESEGTMPDLIFDGVSWVPPSRINSPL